LRRAHRPNDTTIQINSMAHNVAKTATTTLTKVMLEHRQLNGRARNSHLSRHASGQTSEDFIGAKMPKGYEKTVLGTHV
jgi:hypothetical protein